CGAGVRGAWARAGRMGRRAPGAGGPEPQRAAVLGRNRRTGGAVIGRAVGGLLAERADADAAMDAAPAQLALLPAQLIVVHQLHEPLQAFVERHGLESLATRRHAR